MVLECAQTVWRTEARGAVVARLRCAEVRRIAPTVVATGNVVQVRTMTVQVGASDPGGIARHGEDASDDG